ncbi:hypothetical protein [Marisediminicola senii]|uniref:hypothetical protein n=1 Tax=Marisediminicola senii TaxID=2711233 RepID=UPI0013EBC98C|nr:hypothetical protein [Marisediminicola senii]
MLKTVAVVILLLLALSSSIVLSSGTGSTGAGAGGGCGAGTVDPTGIQQAGLEVDGFAGEQLANAAHIMNAATAAGLPTQAQVIGVMTAIGESSLRNITYGDSIYGVTNPDGTPTTSIGLFQQQNSWGDRATRLDPAASATLFYDKLKALPGWETMRPTTAAHRVQRNADPEHYTPFFRPAADIVHTLTTQTVTCTVPGDTRQLAQELVTYADTGALRGGVPDHVQQIRRIAQGQDVPGCRIDPRILQTLLIAIRTFGQAQISDINRHCTGQLAGMGTRSAHYKDGGGYAVDFNRLGDMRTTGADANSLRLLAILDTALPTGSGAGQSNCRTAAGRTIALDNLRQFSDTCHHLHIEVPTQPLAAPTN